MATDFKMAARLLIGSLPDDASWEDLQYQLYVRQQVECGLADDAADRLLAHDEMAGRLSEHKRRKGHPDA